MRTHDHDITPGTLIGDKYRIDVLIGQGGMGTVFKATHTTLNRQVAIKCHRPDSERDPRLVKRLRREAEIAGSLGHDNIYEVTDIGALPDGSPFLVMPYLKGRPLARILDVEAPLSPARACDIVAQTLLALSAAHEAQIVHRDMKPDIMRARKPSKGHRSDPTRLRSRATPPMVEASRGGETPSNVIHGRDGTLVISEYE